MAGQHLGADSVLSRCTAVGFSDQAAEQWSGEDLVVQAVGVPPYPGDTFPRLVGLLEPAAEIGVRDAGLGYVRGDASQPRHDGPAVIAHVVNDRAQRWGGRGFAVNLMQRFPDARDRYEDWGAQSQRPLGAVHLAEAGEGLWIASLVAQSGYGDSPSPRPRVRVAALRDCLQTLAEMARERHATVHVPLIGTGQGGTPWPRIRDLVLEELADRQVETTVYVLPEAAMPDEAPVEDQLSLV